MALLITLVVLLLVFAILFWIIDMIPGDPTFKQIAKAVLALIIVIYLLGALFGGLPLARWPVAG